MLLVGGVMYSNRNQDEEDKEWPDDLNQELDRLSPSISEVFPQQ